MPDQRSRDQAAQLERAVVERLACLRVASQHDLEAAIKAKAVHNVGPHAAARGISGLKEGDVKPGLLKQAGTAQAC